MKNITKIWVAASALLLLGACSKDFLETAPTASVGTANVFASTETVKMAVNGIAYNMTTQQGPYSQGYCGENRIMSIYNEYPSQEFVYNGMSAGSFYGVQYKSMPGCNYTPNTDYTPHTVAKKES